MPQPSDQPGLATSPDLPRAVPAGQLGLATHTYLPSAVPAGQRGLAVQLASNVLLRVLDQAGRPVAGGLALTLSYPGPTGEPLTETLAYAATPPVRRSLPPGATLAVAASGAAFAPASAHYLVPATGPLVATLVVERRLRANRLLRWRG